MSKGNDSIKKTITVALLLCLVCSIVVSTAAVVLRPIQQQNKALDMKTNILAAAGIDAAGRDIEELFAQFEAKVVNLDTGLYAEDIDPASYDQRKASKDPALSRALEKSEDKAGINRRADYAVVYLLREGDDIKRVIIPVHGYGLWSTLYGFMALEGDANTVAGLGFYEHAETPGLGGEVDNPRWKRLWIGKKVYDEEGNAALGLVKGSIDHQDPAAIHDVDALSGATITGNGVTNLVQYWFGDQGFGPYLTNLRAGEV